MIVSKNFDIKTEKQKIMTTKTIWEDKDSFFIELGKPLSKTKTIKETIKVVMYQVGKIFQPVNWSLLLKDSKSDNLIFSVVIGKNKGKLQGRRLPKGEGIAGHIFNTGDPLIVQDVSRDKRFSHRADKHTGFTTNSIIGVPLKTDKTIFGVIELINKTGGDRFTEDDLKVLLTIAEYAAIAIERSYYYQALQKMAFYDPLTGLKNNNHLNNTLHERMDLFDLSKKPSSMMFINVINFVTINEENGYKSGDQVLVALAKILKKSARKIELIYRYQADKFIVLMPQTQVKDAEIIKKRITINHLEYLSHDKNTISFQINIEIQSIEAKKPKDLINIVHKKVFGSMDISRQMYSEPMENNLQVMLEEEDDPQTEEKRNFQGKKVSLLGTFVNFTKKNHGDLTIKRISTKGVSFETATGHAIEKEDLLNLVFNLDDTKKTQIKRQISIQTVDHHYYEATFYNPPPYDKDLGFYFMG
jgi:two-component system cell cycle response regulator